MSYSREHVFKVLFGLVLFLPAAWPGLGGAQEGAARPGIKLGAMEVHPFYRFTETYDSNIYLVPRNKAGGVIVGGGVVGSLITQNKAGFKASLPVGGDAQV
jgi:hypothetical protein